MPGPIFKKKSFGARFRDYFKLHGLSTVLGVVALSAVAVMGFGLTLALGPVGIAIAGTVAIGVGVGVGAVYAKESKDRNKKQIQQGNSEVSLQDYLIVPDEQEKQKRYGAAKNQAHLDARFNYLQQLKQLTSPSSIDQLNRAMRHLELAYANKDKKLQDRYQQLLGRLTGEKPHSETSNHSSTAQLASSIGASILSSSPSTVPGVTDIFIGKPLDESHKALREAFVEKYSQLRDYLKGGDRATLDLLGEFKARMQALEEKFDEQRRLVALGFGKDSKPYAVLIDAAQKAEVEVKITFAKVEKVLGGKSPSIAIQPEKSESKEAEQPTSFKR